jgi:hypothetical protein
MTESRDKGELGLLKVHDIGANLKTSSAGGHGLSPLRSQHRTDK